MRPVIALLAFGSAILGCDSPRALVLGGSRQAIIEGQADEDLAGVVHISHVAGAYVCSGVLIAPQLVLTAKHCVFTRGSEQDEPLAPEGFRVGFGTTTEDLIRYGVTEVLWIGMPGELSVLEAVDRGEDLAALVLDEPAPAQEALRAPLLMFEPVDQQPVRLAGFGLVDSNGVAGQRVAGTGRITGFDPDVGIIQIEGASACYGDSGGPVLDEGGHYVAGIIGQIGDDETHCSTGLTFAATAANPNVRRFLARHCAAMGGCGERSAGSDAGSDSGVDGSASEPDVDGGGNADAGELDANRLDGSTDASPPDAATARAPSGTCTVAHPRGAERPGYLLAWWLGGLLLAARRRHSAFALALWLAAFAGACTAENRDGSSGRDAETDAEVDTGSDASGPSLMDAAGEDAATLPDGASGFDGSMIPMPDASRDSGQPDVDSGEPPHPVSEYCGDAIRDPVLEECDDGPGIDDDACTFDCRVRTVSVATHEVNDDDAAVPDIVDHGLGTGMHVAAASEDGLAVVFTSWSATEGTRVQLQAFSAKGQRDGGPIDVSTDQSPALQAQPAVAALPGARYAVAFTDGSSGTPDIVVRLVDVAGGGMRAARAAHESLAGFQQDVDLLWVGDELIVAWTDLLDLRYRRFDARLRPIAADRALASSIAIESSVSLARFGDGWAAAYRANIDGLERIHVTAGSASWVTPAALPGPTGDRPALVAIDDTSLLLLYTEGTDPFGAGTASVGRLRFAVLSTDLQGDVAVEPWPSLLEPFADDSTLRQSRPSATRVDQRVYVAWQSESATDSTQAQSFIVELGRDPSSGLIERGTESALPFAAPAAPASRENPHLAPSPLFPEGALIALWEEALAPGQRSVSLEYRPSPFVMLQ